MLEYVVAMPLDGRKDRAKLVEFGVPE